VKDIPDFARMIMDPKVRKAMQSLLEYLESQPVEYRQTAFDELVKELEKRNLLSGSAK
jgi:hypothetical protein